MADQPLRELRALLLGEGELEPTLLLALLPVLPEQLLGLAIEITAHIEDQRFLIWRRHRRGGAGDAIGAAEGRQPAGPGLHSLCDGEPTHGGVTSLARIALRLSCVLE